MLTDLLTQRFGRFEVNLAWIPLTIFLATALLVLSASYASLFTENRAKIPALRGYSIVHAWAFFNKRYDFMRSNFERTGHSLFSFRVLQVSSCRAIIYFVMNILYSSTKLWPCLATKPERYSSLRRA